MCAAPAHTISPGVATRRYQNDLMDMESGSKRFGFLGQPMQVRYRGLCAIGSGLWTRNTHFEDVWSCCAHDLARSSLYALPEWSNGHGKRFKELRSLRTANPSAISRVVHNRLRALCSKHTHFEGVCSSTAHELTRSRLYAKPEWSN